MTPEEFASLSDGDIVRHKTSASRWLVDGKHGNVVILVATRTATRADEWDLALKSNHQVAMSGVEVLEYLKARPGCYMQRRLLWSGELGVIELGEACTIAEQILGIENWPYPQVKSVFTVRDRFFGDVPLTREFLERLLGRTE